jgi:hypothetical protein
MKAFLLVAGFTAAAVVLGAGLLHLIPRLGTAGRRVSAWCCRAPGLDLLITYFTVAPLFVGPIVAGWAGFAGAVAGQVAGMLLWQTAHEVANRKYVKGPRIVKVLNRIVGPWRNYTAVWITAIVTPVFWLVRLAQVALYPFLVKLVGFPAYNEGEWVNVSRQKFCGLVGHDLIWCLYCDWMTGVWSLGTEMLRNVESFWCPIRFDSAKKCANCAIDFPDVDHGWVPAGATMAEVAETVQRMHAGPSHAWFGHPSRVRLTVNGEDATTPREAWRELQEAGVGGGEKGASGNGAGHSTTRP